MHVYFECENGHRLKARAASSGRETHCPRCQAQVVVPERQAKAVTDSSIVRLLTDDDMKSLHRANAAKTTAEKEPAEEAKPATVECPRCSETIPASSRSCEHCGLYITVNAGAWSSVLQTAKRYVRSAAGRER